MTPVLAVELDDQSHQREIRKDRDAFVDGVFAAAGVPLLHIPAKNTYVLQDVLELIAGHLQPSGASVSAANDGNEPEATIPPAPAPHSATADSSPPQCSKCESEMILRTASKGGNKGKRFWGCTSYPKCRNVIAID